MKSLLIAIMAITLASACTKKAEEPAAASTEAAQTAAAPADATAQTAAATTEPKVEVVDVTPGTGAEAVAGKTVVVNYTGTLTDGTQFDTSVGKAPFSFKLGAGEVIKGWDQGLLGMKVKGKRKLTIPAALGYGANAMGKIPANSTLVFDVELIDVK
jgi:FKBP-type peptidyl-prolyl cis-trans isomerase FkpA